MTKRAKDALRFIVFWYERGGPLPIYQEIGDHLGCARSAAIAAVGELEESGLVIRAPGSPRYGLALDRAEVEAMRSKA